MKSAQKFLICVWLLWPRVAAAQDVIIESGSADPIDVSAVMDRVGAESAATDPPQENWWRSYATQSISDAAHPIPASVNDLLQLALMNSAKIRVAEYVPQIRETAITEAQADFDWSQFVDSMWRDVSEPVGSALTVGGSGTRYRNHELQIDGGVRRKTIQGGNVELYQRFGYQESNSSFFVPNDQATTRLVLGFTQPLLRGRGKVYNSSLVLLAQIDVGSAYDELSRQLQAHLLEVTRGYWALYLERVSLAQKVKLYLQTEKITEHLERRQQIDAQRSQLASAQAALESRRSDLIRARTAIKNAETRLRTLLNTPEFAGDPESMEIIPIEHPTSVLFETDLESEFQTALQNRPEIAASLKSIRASCVRMRMATHEVLPVLNLVTETYLSGLRGNADFGDSWLDQFRAGEPSYSVGLQYEVKLGRRASQARLNKRQLELAQLKEEYRNVLELTRAEVEVAVRELETSHRELLAKNRSLRAAEFEAETLDIRWKNLADPGSTGGLLLDSLLRAQERVTGVEFEVAQAQLTYNLALTNMRYANGTLFQVLPDTGAGLESTMELDGESSAPAAIAIVDAPSPRVGPLPTVATQPNHVVDTGSSVALSTESVSGVERSQTIRVAERPTSSRRGWNENIK